MRLRFLADRLDPRSAPGCTGLHFRYDVAANKYVLDATRRGCPVWYMGEDDYQRAWGPS